MLCEQRQWNIKVALWLRQHVITCVRCDVVWRWPQSGIQSACKGSPYSITERRVPELIPVLGSQHAGDVSYKPGGRLPLLSARPAVTPATLKRAATNFAVWWTEAQWVWTVCLRLLPDSVAAAIWTRALLRLVQHANHSATEPSCQHVITCARCDVVWQSGTQRAQRRRRWHSGLLPDRSTDPPQTRRLHTHTRRLPAWRSG